MTTESSWSSSKTCLTLTPASLLSSDDAMGWLVRMQQAIKEQLTYPSLTQEERFHLFGRAEELARRGLHHAPQPLSSRSASGKRVALTTHPEPTP